MGFSDHLPSFEDLKGFWPEYSMLSRNKKKADLAHRRSPSNLPAVGIRSVKTRSGELFLATIEGYMMCLLGNPKDSTMCDFAPRLPRERVEPLPYHLLADAATLDNRSSSNAPEERFSSVAASASR